MSRADNWVAIDKNIKQEFKYIDRPYSIIEALLSFSIDFNCGSRWTYAGYAKLWQWSRDKVRKFVTDLQSESGYSLERQKTHYRHPIHLIHVGSRKASDTIPTLSRPTDSRHSSDTPSTDSQHSSNTLPTDNRHQESRVGEGERETSDTLPTDNRRSSHTPPTYGQHTSDTRPSTSNETKIKTNKKITAAALPAAGKNPRFYKTKNNKILSDVKLAQFETFWSMFADKRGKAAAADAWLKLGHYDKALLQEIYDGAKNYANQRPAL